MRTWLATLVFALIVAFGVGSAEARKWLDFLPPLTDVDMELAKQAARVDLEGKPEGTSLGWKNDKSGNSGSVVLLRRFENAGRECRRLQHIINIRGEKDTRHYEVTICLQEDGSWKWP